MAKKIKLPPRGTPLPDNIHPKDLDNGAIIRVGCHDVRPECVRGTVLLTAGGVWLELTPDAARAFVKNIQCAIDCVDRPAVGKS